MKRTKRILSFFGTRPEAIKMAPVIQELKLSGEFDSLVALSAQHRDMLDQVMDLFGLQAQADFDLMRHAQSLSDITSGVLHRLGSVLDQLKPELVLVHGDTTTSMAGALAAYYRKIPVGHVEAGLRSFDPYQPFPEEMNRRLTDALSSLHFPPTVNALINLRRENIHNKFCFVTGNTVIDALLNIARKRMAFNHRPLGQLIERIQKKGQKFILMTAHRRENFGKPFEEAFSAVNSLCKRFPQVHWVYPVHPNPQVSSQARRKLQGCSNCHLFKPLDYSDLVNALKASTLVVTDSGGLQEEAPALGKPVLVLRDVTERPEAVKAGTVRLIGTDRNKIMSSVSLLLNNNKALRKMENAINPYGDGKASKRIVQAIRVFFGLSNRTPEVFRGH